MAECPRSPSSGRPLSTDDAVQSLITSIFAATMPGGAGELRRGLLLPEVDSTGGSRSRSLGTVFPTSGTKYERYQYSFALVLDIGPGFLNTDVVLTLVKVKIVSDLNTLVARRASEVRVSESGK
jgi:hypothetical protein